MDPLTDPSSRWTTTPPTELGDYWFWNGVRDKRPITVAVVMKFQTEFFCNHPDYADLIKVEDLDGWWHPNDAPELPTHGPTH